MDRQLLLKSTRLFNDGDARSGAVDPKVPQRVSLDRWTSNVHVIFVFFILGQVNNLNIRAFRKLFDQTCGQRYEDHWCTFTTALDSIAGLFQNACESFGRARRGSPHLVQAALFA